MKVCLYKHAINLTNWSNRCSFFYPEHRLYISVNSHESISLINALKPDLILSILAGEIFKNDFIKIPPLGILNAHTGQLPKYKGLMPTFWALKNKEPVIGISTFLVNEVIDGGKVLGYHEVNNLNYSHFNLMERIYKEIWVSINLAIKNIINTKECSLPEFLPEQYFSAPSKVDVDEFIANGGRLF